MRHPSNGPGRLVTSLGIVAAFLLATPANAAFPGRDGRIAVGAWATPKRVKHEIFTMRPDGSGLQRLAITPGAHPDFSPDGRSLAFNRPYDGGIWTALADGSRPTEVVAVREPWSTIEHPAFAPDGGQIAFTASWEESGPEDASAVFRQFVYIASLGGTAHRRRAGNQPAWAPDGKLIAYVNRRYDAIRAMRADGSRPRTLVRTKGFPRGLDFSPDGRKLLFTERRSIEDGTSSEALLRVVDVRTRETQTLPVPPNVLCAAWAPSGKRIAYLWERYWRPGEGAPTTEIWTARPDGSRRQLRVRLTRHRWAESISWQPRTKRVGSDGSASRHHE